MWVTWRLLVFGRVSWRLRLQGEEEVTIWEIVAVAAAAGGKKGEVGLGRVWLPCLLWAAFSGDGAGRGEGNQG